MAESRGFCHLSIDKDYKFVAYLSDLSVLENSRRNGIGNYLLEASKKHARKMGAKTLCLWTDSNQWMFDWYQRHGFKHIKTYKNGMAKLTFYLE